MTLKGVAVKLPDAGWVELDTTWLGLAQAGDAYELDDLLNQQTFMWRGGRNFVILQPGQAHVMRLRRGVRNERDSEWFQR